jgi:hypothetical protein
VTGRVQQVSAGRRDLTPPVIFPSPASCLGGRSTGVEADIGEAEPLIDEPFDPAEIDVITRTMTVDLLLSRLRRRVLDLQPEFQRLAGIWNEDKQSKLIESLLLRIPLPTMYAAEEGGAGMAG